MSSSRRKDGSVSLSEQDFEQIESKTVEAAMTVIRKELNERLSVGEIGAKWPHGLNGPP